MVLTTRYSGAQMALHWATASLIAANYFISDGMGDALDAHIAGDPVVGLTPVWHVWAGTTLLALVVLRLIVRAASGVPDAKDRNIVLAWGSKIGHWVLYTLMFSVPALGALTWYGKLDRFGSLHILVMNILMITILGHATMAIFHHYVLKDGLLTRMIPFRRA